MQSYVDARVLDLRAVVTELKRNQAGTYSQAYGDGSWSAATRFSRFPAQWGFSKLSPAR